MVRSWIQCVALLATGVASQQNLWEKCGGKGWIGPTACVAGAVCNPKNEWYSQCEPGTVAAVANALTTFATLTRTTQPVSAPTSSSDQTRYAGINIAGFDFGCKTDGTCSIEGTYGPITDQNDGVAQMQHFVRDDKLNAFRLPVAWQYLVNNKQGGPLYDIYFANFHKLMQGCLDTGALCIIDIHNYGRWDNAIIGQGGPSNDAFSNLWSQLAKKYVGSKNAAFGIINEPHDLNIDMWADTVQAAVKAIRDAGAKDQYIFLPGTDYASAGSFISSRSATALAKVKNPDGSTDNLIFEVHRYLDATNAGTSPECLGDSVDSTFAPLADWLRKNKRMAFIGEIGGGNTPSCEQYVCQALRYLDKNADVYLGYTGWGAGSFQADYTLSLRPSGNTDSALAKKCFSRA